jgi:hypothetical protein
MNDMGDFESGQAYLPDAPNLVVEIITFEILLGADVREDAIALTLPDIEGLTIPRV